MPRAACFACSCVALLLFAGCKATAWKTPLASIRRAHQEMKTEITDALRTTQRQVSRTWADVRHDWNYTEVDGFADMRNASGM